MLQAQCLESKVGEVCVRACMCMCACMCACMCVHACVCACACVCVYACAVLTAYACMYVCDTCQPYCFFRLVTGIPEILKSILVCCKNLIFQVFPPL